MFSNMIIILILYAPRVNVFIDQRVADEGSDIDLLFTFIKPPGEITECYFYKVDKTTNSSYSSYLPVDGQVIRMLNHPKGIILKINNISKLNFGKYRCGSTTSYQEIKLVVETQPIFKVNQRIALNEEMFYVNNIYNICCEKRGISYPEIFLNTKQMIGERVNKSRTTFICIINISYNDMDNDSYLRCSSSTSKLIATIKIKTEVLPNITIIQNATLIAGKKATILCNVKSKSFIDTFWIKQGEIISGKEQSIYSEKYYFVKNMLQFKPNVNDNNQQLVCAIANNVENNATIIMQVNYPPDNISVIPSILYGPFGNFSCIAKSNPSPLYIWMFNNNFVANGSLLRFSNSVKHLDNGRYYCKATNEFGFTEGYGTLFTIYRPICQGNKTINIKKGTIITLECDVNANPQAQKFQWFNPFPVGETKTLIITPHETSSYSCIANNSEGQSDPCVIYIYVDDKFSNSSLIYMLVVILILIVYALVYLYIRQKHHQKFDIPQKRKTRSRIYANEKIILSEIEPAYYSKINSSDGYHQKEIGPFNVLKSIPFIKVDNLKYIGCGYFSQVYKGICELFLKPGSSKKLYVIAVKLPQDSDNGENVENKYLMAELEIHYGIPSHENVIKCYGQTIIKGKLGIVTEFAENGTLKSFLLQMHHLAQCKQSHDENTFYEWNCQCLKFSREIALGMVHLTKQQIVHRDIAARNILLGQNNICKICDFGLARDIYTTSVYKMESDDAIPIRWLSPESLFYNTYNQKSDVWSFGMLLWEIITLGVIPYPNLKERSAVKDAIQAGYQMLPPKHSSVEICDIMESCWSYNPNDRPTFEILEKCFSNLLEDNKQYINFKDFNISCYENNPNLETTITSL